MLRYRVFGVEEIERPGQGIHKTVGDAPGMATFAEAGVSDG